MNAQRKQKTIATLAVVLIVSLFAATGFAQQGQTDAALKFVGTIEAVSANSVMVNGHEIFFENAAINTDLTVGTSVMIEGSLTSDNRIEATRIDLADADFLLPDELRITGVLDSSSGSSFDFGGSLIDSAALDANAALSAGAVVRVFANADDTGAWSARRVQLLNRSSADVSADADLAADFDLFAQGRYQLVGTLDAVTEDSVTVSGMTIDTTGADIQGGLVLGALANVWLENEGDASFRAAAVSNATIDADAETDAFIDLSDATSTDTSANFGADANVETNAGVSSDDSSTHASANADADVNAGADADSDSTEASAGLNINLGGGVSISLGG